MCYLLMSWYLTDMDTSQAVEDMGQKMQEYQARIEELEKVAAAEARWTAEQALCGVKRRHDGSPVNPGTSAAEGQVGDGNRMTKMTTDGEAHCTQGTNRQVIVPLIKKVPIKLREKIWEFQYVDLTELLPEGDKLNDSPLCFLKLKMMILCSM